MALTPHKEIVQMGRPPCGGEEESSFHLFLVCEGAAAQQSSLILQHMQLALSPSRSSITPMANATILVVDTGT